MKNRDKDALLWPKFKAFAKVFLDCPFLKMQTLCFSDTTFAKKPAIQQAGSMT
jgi:hypothetical protein